MTIEKNVENFSIDDIPKVYYLNSAEQLKALAEPLRYRMCMLLNKPMTCAGLARRLKIARPKAHYHLKKLQSVDLVKPYSEEMFNGILEKYYVIAGRVLDFSQLVPKTGATVPEDVSVESVSAISDYLASMLHVARENVMAASQSYALGKGFFFDADIVLTQEQFQMVKAKMYEIREEVVALSLKNSGENVRSEDLLSFHLSSNISLKTETNDDDD
ncbi:winged helix-turn-helix domain-containing protein [Rhodalgimonas zhirmunskyi]|uniref:Helix-turn-helix domain-containing protein n=1 Tax=Rhodalgimonas zhirmunskyi TaxID=2964767 RepID=A0AAJ1X3W4_9RHOB|nr:helix-turn-helix domain-containing protein [Rhodoalgimonas zhirmunskyi]MDQ2092494.1 helix-turn-helix domain-containing protein [Rhodoalgimonas zhirmunskyi]